MAEQPPSPSLSRWLTPGTFILLGLIWGSSFLWIKIAVDEIPPATLVAYRMSLGALGMLAFLAVSRQLAIPRGRQLVFPVVGVTLGVVALGEVLDWRLVLGTVLVTLGIGVVSLRYDASVSRVANRGRG
ncbi:MAG: DMT family transporter [Chloroflexota bacterium]|nr:DMT family transporter [Chloroflexota bacterium]